MRLNSHTSAAVSPVQKAKKEMISTRRLTSTCSEVRACAPLACTTILASWFCSPVATTKPTPLPSTTLLPMNTMLVASRKGTVLATGVLVHLKRRH